MKLPLQGWTLRTVASAVGMGAVVGATMLSGAATASAEPAMPPPPNCSPADWAGIRSGVAAATSAYLFTHPAVNDFFATLQGQSREEIQPQMQAYLGANPQVRNELQAIKQPADDFLTRCNSSPRAFGSSGAGSASSDAP